ncbi:MAG TPA: DUF3500 domain-containing protein [Chitinophagaceae bacterium]|nr:DUF3500 domain-containing protein [Chitinophagaceae bacterium]
MPKQLFSAIFMAIIFIFPVHNAQSQSQYYTDIKNASLTFINSLDPMQKRSALLAFGDTARIKWNNLPVGMRARAGISIGNMNDDQRKLLHRILSVSLSSQGYLKATSIMHLDNLLNWYYDTLYYREELNDANYKSIKDLKWSHRNYYLAFFGLPTDSTWGYKLEGHHLSINFTFAGNKLSVTPWFIGTDPAEFPISEYAGWRVLGQEEDLGIQLIHLLSPSLQKKATMSSDVPRDIITGAESGKRLIDNWGVKGSEMTKEQQTILQYIVREFVFNMEYEKATIEYDKILKAGIGNVYFGWIGPYEESKPHYYVLNGPTFLIEFDNCGANGNGNHIHAIWREKGNEFGEDVLKAHYLSEKH